jgi:hypothetical protein
MSQERLRSHHGARVAFYPAVTREAPMNDFAKTATELFQLGSKIARVYTDRLWAAQNAFSASVTAAVETLPAVTAGDVAGA